MADPALSQSGTELPDADASGTPWWKSASILRWMTVIVVASLVVQGTIYLLVSKSAAGRTATPTEYTVGTFSFIPDGSVELPEAPGKFDLHVRFVDDLDSAAHRRLIAHQFRVREAVEGLLRKSHGLELTDTALARLKHEIQERIDEALDLRAVAEVIITDLSVDQPPSIPSTRAIENASLENVLPQNIAVSSKAPAAANPPSQVIPLPTSTKAIDPAAENSAVSSGY